MKIPYRIGVIVFVAALVGCGSGGDASAPGTSAGAGTIGVSFNVSVFRPSDGTITSQDGQIRCGTGGSACTGRYAWTAQAVLTATPDAGYTFGTWAGDCQYTGPCVLDTRQSGADKFVNAVFGPAGVVQHGNFTNPSIHGQAYFDRLAKLPTSLDCTNAQCHGPRYSGAGIAPSCNTCHVNAGWANWQQSCSFCHGLKNATTKAGYDFALHADWAAPPDDISQRLTGVSHGASGAHQKHVSPNIPNAVRAPIACSECHVVPATAIHQLNNELDIPFGPLSRGQGAQPTWDAETLTCGTNYCHGSFSYGGVQGTNSSLAWTGSLNGCQTCHAMPPVGHAFGGSADPRSCSSCHPDTVLADGTIDLAKGKHINGEKDAAGGACDACHWFPGSATKAPTGAHLAHYGLTAEQGSSGFGDLKTLQDRYPNDPPTSAPAVYAFGCSNCHPIEGGQHSMGSGSTLAKVWLYEATAPSTSLKAKNLATAAYDRVAKTCTNIYCHSSGQSTPSFRTTPPWNSTTRLTCAGCHDNPPRYVSGGAGTATANSHVVVEEDGYEAGHFLGERGPWHTSQHGVGGTTDAAPITCETCHYGTTNPASRGPNGTGFYWLDTTGSYTVPGSWASVNDPMWEASIQCTSCHGKGNPNAPLQQGKVLPLRHVNGTRDVVFDPRTSVAVLPWLPASPNTPLRPYWLTDASRSVTGWQPGLVVWSGTTLSFDLSTSQYNSTTKTCTNVACHMADLAPRWGTTNYMYGPNWGCANCHPGYGGY